MANKKPIDNKPLCGSFSKSPITSKRKFSAVKGRTPPSTDCNKGTKSNGSNAPTEIRIRIEGKMDKKKENATERALVMRSSFIDSWMINFITLYIGTPLKPTTLVVLALMTSHLIFGLDSK